MLSEVFNFAQPQRTKIILSNAVEQQQSKAELRRMLLKQRRSLSADEWQEKSDRICTHLCDLPIFTQAQTVLAYFSFRQEPDLSRLFINNKYRWGFPLIVNKSLSWHSWKPGEPLFKGEYGIFAPHPDAETIKATEVDLILVPAVACDGRGYRLGYGGGFYDRLLGSPEWAMKPTIGIVFKFAYLSQLPIDEWDKPLQGVCTETDCYMFPL